MEVQSEFSEFLSKMLTNNWNCTCIAKIGETENYKIEKWHFGRPADVPFLTDSVTALVEVHKTDKEFQMYFYAPNRDVEELIMGINQNDISIWA